MKKILIFVFFVLATGVVFYFYNNKEDNYNIYEGEATTNLENNEAFDDNIELLKEDQRESVKDGSVSSTLVKEKSFTLSEISTHNSKTSCYSAVNGSVYDLTNWIDAHPGGEKAILSICGKDGSNLFNKKHGGKETPENELLKMKIGVLSN